jgi:hypothetical protein
MLANIISARVRQNKRAFERAQFAALFSLGEKRQTQSWHLRTSQDSLYNGLGEGMPKSLPD